MTHDASVRRQARALLEVAERTSDPDRVAGELDAIARSLEQDGDTARLLVGGALPPSRKVDALRAVADRLGLTPVTAKLLVILAERDQLRAVPALAAAYRQRLRERRNIATAEVTTAVPLPATAADAIARRLGEVTGKRIELATRVDPSIVGGVVARMGSLVYDGSVTGQLARIREKLVENV